MFLFKAVLYQEGFQMLKQALKAKSFSSDEGELRLQKLNDLKSVKIWVTTFSKVLTNPKYLSC